MKKVLLGLLFLIPVVILLLVAAVSKIVSTQAYIGVESISITTLSGENGLVFNLSEIGNDPIDLNNYLSVTITPEMATNKTVEWSLMDVRCLDEEYESSYNYYLDNKSVAEKVNPAVMLVDENKNEVESNTSGLLLINAYSTFSIRATAESFSDTIHCQVVGYDVENINLVDKDNQGQLTLKVGESAKLYPNYTPIDSIILDSIWYSTDESIVRVDQNGVVTSLKSGTAYIYLKGNKYSDQETYVESNRYKVLVESSSSIYGSLFYSHLSSLSLSELEIDNAVVISGGTIDGNELTITSSICKLSSSKGEVEIILCDEDAIVIENASLLNSESGEVIEVGTSNFKLKAKFLSSLNNGTVSVVWTSSDNKIAEVNNGVISAKSNGFVTITATSNGKSAVIELNVRKKVSAMSLYTSNNYYEKVIGGLARETVFASERFVNYPTSEDKAANYTYIYVRGTETLIGEELKESIASYNFEIVNGSEYAYFDSDEANKLIFKSSLEGKGKQKIKILVSAKYPKYVTKTNYTKEEVTIKVVYGVEVKTVYELKKASLLQKDYAYLGDNLITGTDDIYTCYQLDEETKVSSKRYYAISLMSDIYYPKTYEDPFYTFFGVENMYDASSALYGNLYGNNHIVAGYRDLFDAWAPLFRVTWSDVTISNVIIRANQLEGNTEIVSGDEQKELRGKDITFGSEESDSKYRLRNIRVEYTILENTYQTMDIRNSDVMFDGCVLRNLCSVGTYVPTRNSIIDGKLYPLYSHVSINNFVVSNALGSAFSVSQEGCLVDRDTGEYIFSSDSEENERQIREQLQNKGFVSELRQTGFLDIYNWQSTDSVKLLQSGDDTVDSLVGSLSQGILNISKLDKFRYRYKGVDYFNLGFIVSGLTTTSGGIQVEPVFANVYLGDSRLSSFSLTDLQGETDPLLSTVSKFTLTIYGYTNSADLKPSSLLKINDKFIEKLHS